MVLSVYMETSRRESRTKVNNARLATFVSCDHYWGENRPAANVRKPSKPENLASIIFLHSDIIRKTHNYSHCHEDLSTSYSFVVPLFFRTLILS